MASLPGSTPSTRDKRKPQTSYGGRVRYKPESGIQVRKGCLMSLTVMHETVLHVAQIHPPTWETDGILSGSPRRGGSALVPVRPSRHRELLRIDPHDSLCGETTRPAVAGK
jgi:hypothetical protein